jgi:hypothetical protein
MPQVVVSEEVYGKWPPQLPKGTIAAYLKGEPWAILLVEVPSASSRSVT